MVKKKLSLIERKTNLYNRLSEAIENCNFVTENPSYCYPGVVKTAKKYRLIFRATQALLDDIFNGEDS